MVLNYSLEAQDTTVTGFPLAWPQGCSSVQLIDVSTVQDYVSLLLAWTKI